MSPPELKEQWLTDQLDQAPNIPLLVVDFKVYAHQIHGFTESALSIAGDDDEARIRRIVKALWAYRLNRGVDNIPYRPYTILITDDVKGQFPNSEVFGYWRSLECSLLGLPEYKGGRSAKPSLFPIILEEGLNYVKSPGSNFYFFDKPYYEADDIAGKVARIQRTSPPLDRHILLSTLDGDWQGLVSDAHKIIWCNTGPWLPRIRTEAEVCDYYLRKEKLDIKSARDTYTVKVEVGDRGDNLMPGTPLRFFDLYEEDEVWGWTEDEVETLCAAMSSQVVSNRPDHLQSAKNYLQSIGMFLPEIPAPTPTDVLLFSEKSKKERREALNPGLKGLQKKHCIGLEQDSEFQKCLKTALADIAAQEKIKELEEKKKSTPELFDDGDKGLLKSLRTSRQDHKVKLLRFKPH